MKNQIFAVLLFSAFMVQAQEKQPTPQISVTGEGKVKVAPDHAIITIGIQNTGKDAKEVKSLNDQTADKVIKYLKKFGLKSSEYQTTRVTLNQTHDYITKKKEYQAWQSLSITLNDLKKYDELMIGLFEQGVNNVSNVEFKSTKMEEHKTEARKLAVQDAKKRAEDYVSVLGQKVGKALAISENSYMAHPPMYKAMSMDAIGGGMAERETLAIGEIEITANVSVSFLLD